MQVQEKRRRGRPKKIWIDNIRKFMKEYNMTEEMAEHRRSVCFIEIKARPLLHGGSIQVRRWGEKTLGENSSLATETASAQKKLSEIARQTSNLCNAVSAGSFRTK